MERPGQKLWRKIGLQKNFLQGTSHSDQSKNTFSQLQQSLIKSQCSKSNHNSDNQKLKTIPHKYQNYDEFSNEYKNGKKFNIVEQNSCQTPINKLNSSSFQDCNMIWQVADQTIDLIKSNKNNAVQLSSQGKQSLLYFESINNKYQQAKKQTKYTDQQQGNKIPKTYEAFYSNKTYKKQEPLLNKIENNKKPQIQEMKIRLYGAEQKQSFQIYESQNNKNKRKQQNIKCAEYKYTLQIEIRQLQRYQQIERQISKLKSEEMPMINELVLQIRKKFMIQKNEISSQLIQMRRYMTQLIKHSVSQQIQQLTDQIGYLYEENQQLMSKIEQKQIMIKKYNQEHKIYEQKISQYENKYNEQNQSKSILIKKLQNEINVLQEKFEDVQELQGKNEQLNKQIKELKNRIQVLVINEQKYKQVIRLKGSQIVSMTTKSKQLQWQINELYVKNQQIQYRLKRQYNEQLIKGQQQHIKRLNIQKVFLQRQKDKNKQLQNKNKQLQNNIFYTNYILQSTLKYLNIDIIKHIQQQINIQQQSQYIQQIFNRVGKQNSFQCKNNYYSQPNHYDHKQYNQLSNQQSLTQNISNHQQLKLTHLSSNQLSPKSDSDNNSSNKNLRTTGFFGQVTKPILNIRLDDLQKIYSTQIPQSQENYQSSHQYNNHHINNLKQSINQNKKTLFRGDTFSEISKESATSKQDYSYRSKLPISSKLQQKQRKLNKQQHNRYESDPMQTPLLNDSISQDLNRIKSSFQEDQYNTYNNYSNALNTSYHRKNLNINTHNENNPIANYSFSQLNFNNGLDSIQDDRSSTTTYQKSQSQRYPNKSYGYQRPPTDRSDKSNSDRQDIIQKIKQRVKQKLRSKDKNKNNQPSYTSQVQNSFQRRSYNDSNYQQHKPIHKQDLILADFYQKHSNKNNPLINQTQIQRKLSPHSTSRSPSNTRSRSPSNSSASRVPTHTSRIGATKYTPTTTPNYNNLNKTSGNITTKATFSKSLVQRPQFVAYSRKTNHVNPTATYQTKGALYSMNRGQTQTGSSYIKKY